MMWLGVLEDDGSNTGYSGIINASGPLSTAFWDSWFSEYTRIVKQYAQIAKNLGIEYIALGHDMSYAVGKSRFSSDTDAYNRWKGLMDAVRNDVGYTGKLGYFGYASPNGTIYFDDGDYPSGFIGLMDFIGVNLANVNDTFNPTREALKSSLRAILDRFAPGGVSASNKPVFVMVRTPSVDGGTSISAYIEPSLLTDREADKHDQNLFQQADLYEALLEVVNETPTGNGRVMGIFTWGYHYEELYTTSANVNDRDLAMDKSANVRDKPAEAVLKYWFERF